MRHFPNIEDPSKPTVHELAITQVSDIRVDDVWAGDADLKFFASASEEIAALSPIEMLGGFFHSMGVTITGGKVIYKY
jgi:acetoacetate decarboxylase